MFAITGITGKVGGATAHALLAAGLPVRAVLRDAGKAENWAQRGCEVAIAEMEDAEALAAAFKGARGVFVLPPSCFDPEPGFPEARAVIDAVARALATARPDKVVCLSTVGAHSTRPNLLSQRTLIELELSRASMPVTFLRPAWFMENVAWDIAGVKANGMLRSFLQPLDRAIPMVATADIGKVAAELLRQDWVGKRVVELEGPTNSMGNSWPPFGPSFEVRSAPPYRAVRKTNWRRELVLRHKSIDRRAAEPGHAGDGPHAKKGRAVRAGVESSGRLEITHGTVLRESLR